MSSLLIAKRVLENDDTHQRSRGFWKERRRKRKTHAATIHFTVMPMILLYSVNEKLFFLEKSSTLHITKIPELESTLVYKEPSRSRPRSYLTLRGSLQTIIKKRATDS